MPAALVAVDAGRPAEFCRPDDERVVQQAATLEVAKQTRDWLIDDFGMVGVLRHVAMLVPVVARAAVDDLDEPDAALRQPPRDEAFPAETFSLPGREPVEGERVFRLARKIKGVAGLRLHVEGGLERADPRRESLIVAPGLEVAAVELSGQPQFEFLHAGLGRAAIEIRNRRRAGNDANALVIRGQKIVRVNLRPRVGKLLREDHERRQILIDGPQAVAHPGSDARPREEERAGMNRERRVVVLVVVGLHRLDQADVVHALPQVREEVAHERSTISAGPELPQRLQQDALLIREAAANAGRLAVGREQLRLVVEGVHVRDAAIGEDEDHPFGARRAMRLLGRQRVGRGAGRLSEQLREDARHQQRASDETLQDVATRGTGRLRHDGGDS